MIIGTTPPAAHAADRASEPNRRPRLFVFHLLGITSFNSGFANALIFCSVPLNPITKILGGYCSKVVGTSSYRIRETMNFFFGDNLGSVRCHIQDFTLTAVPLYLINDEVNYRSIFQHATIF